jgi:hypothetical protein
MPNPNAVLTQPLSTVDAAALAAKLDAADYNQRFLGLYSSSFDLIAAYPTSIAGDYAQVDMGIGSDVIVYAWDVSDAQWSAVGSSVIANTDALPQGSSNLYYTDAKVRDTPLTGLSTATATPITAADTVRTAAGKLQAQATANAAAISGKASSTHTHLIADVTGLQGALDAKLETTAAAATVRGTALTGLSTATATPVTAADTVLIATGKLQGQTSANATAIALKAEIVQLTKAAYDALTAPQKASTTKLYVIVG